MRLTPANETVPDTGLLSPPQPSSLSAFPPRKGRLSHFRFPGPDVRTESFHEPGLGELFFIVVNTAARKALLTVSTPFVNPSLTKSCRIIGGSQRCPGRQAAG